MSGAKPIMGQSKILVSAGQQPVKMQASQHIGFMPVSSSCFFHLASYFVMISDFNQVFNVLELIVLSKVVKN